MNVSFLLGDLMKVTRKVVYFQLTDVSPPPSNGGGKTVQSSSDTLLGGIDNVILFASIGGAAFLCMVCALVIWVNSRNRNRKLQPSQIYAPRDASSNVSEI